MKAKSLLVAVGFLLLCVANVIAGGAVTVPYFSAVEPYGQYFSAGETLLDQQYSPLMLDASGRLIVSCATGCTGGGSGGGQYNSTLPTYTSGSTSTFQTDSRGRQLVSLQSSAGNNMTIDSGGRLLATLQSSAGNAISIDAGGRLLTMIQSSAGNSAVIDTSGMANDNVATTTNALATSAYQMAYNPSTTQWERIRSESGVSLESDGGANTTISSLSSATSAAPLYVKATAGRIAKLINTSTASQSVTVTLINQNTGAAVAGNVVYQAQLGPGQVIDLQIYCSTGIGIYASGGATGNIVLTWS